MNHIYRSIWNQATGAYSAVSENVKGSGKRALPGGGGAVAQFALKALAASMMLGFGSLALAGPTGGVVVAGQANIGGGPGSMVINQGSQNAVINWNNFNIAHGESVTFQQPNSASVVLNRVLGGDATAIMGNLSANGKVFLVNPNGVLFGKGASVNVGGLVASTLDISNADFMAGNYKFSGNGTGKVLNQGVVNAPGGYVALLGANVSNEGTISARLGSVALAAGNAITLDVAGDGLLNVTVDKGALNALVANGGLIQADGGTVVLTAQAAGDLLKTVVNNTGIIEAHSIDTRGGTIKLLGDMQSGTVNAAGTLDASAPGTGNGGFVETSAAHVNIADGINVTTKAANGLSGTWLIDPVDFNIAVSGGNITGTTLSNNLKNGVVQILSTDGTGGTAGDINVNDTVSWSANKLTLTAQNNININKPLRGSGTASLALEYGQQAVAAGNTSVYNVKAEVDLPSGKNFSTLLGSNGTATVYTVINSLGVANSSTGTDLQGLQGALSGNFVLGANIDASATSAWNGGLGFTPIGLNTDNNLLFSGQFDGLGHVINGLNITNTTPLASAALFSGTSAAASVRNIGLSNVAITGNVTVVASGNYGYASALVGVNNGTIDNAYVSSGTVSASRRSNGGGLVGLNNGLISNSYNNSAVTATTVKHDGWLGGLVGNTTVTSKIVNSYNSGNVTGLYVAAGLVSNNLGSITNSFNTGAVSGANDAGGLVVNNRAFASAVITNSFNTGAVSGSSTVGGVAAITYANSKISNSYSTGAVTNLGLTTSNSANTATGGLVGVHKGQITNSYATGAVSGASGTTVGTPSGVGGVVGTIGPAGNVTNVYSSGAVSLTAGATGTLGGVVGIITAANGSVVNGYYNTTLNPTVTDGVGNNTINATVTSVTGLTSTQMRTASSFDNFSFTSTPGAADNNWVIVNADGTLNGTGNTGAAGPMLSSEYSTTIKSSHQLQLMAMNLTGNYTLAMDVNAAGTGTTSDVWSGATFVPVGASNASDATRFTGSFDGAGHVISGLVINRPNSSYAGLFGATGSSAIVRNVGLEGGSVTGSNSSGGLVGLNLGLIDGSYSTNSVTGGSQVGGLVGLNGTNSGVPGIISNSYASGAVTGTGIIGGMVGTNSGTLTNNYASGAVTGGNTRGGLTADSNGSASGNFWDITTSGVATSAAATGLTTAQMKLLSTYSGAAWNLASTWIVYDTNTYPLLRAFMTPLQVTFASSPTKTYDGTSTWAPPAVTNSNAYAYALLSGSLNYGAAGTAVNAGTYAITARGLYSGQHGYAIDSNAASLTIAPKTLTVTGATAATRTYDRSTGVVVSGGALSGLVGTETLLLSGLSGTYADKNAGSAKAVTVTGAAVNDAGSGATAGLASNYTVSNPTSVTGTVNTAAITSVSGLTAGNRVYDGTNVAVLGGTAVINGMITGDNLVLSSASATFSDKNVGAGKSVGISSITLGGSDLVNYSFSNTSATTTASISAKALTVTGVLAGNKVYDGNLVATLSGGTLSGLVGTETLTLSGQSGAFGDQNAGTGKVVTVTGAALSDAGSGATAGRASNYTVSNATGVTANITPKALTVTGVTAGNKTYDGSTAAALSGGALSGLVGTETLNLSTLSGAFIDKNVGASKAVTVTGAVLTNAGSGATTGLASNYTVSNPAGVSANITQKALTLNGMTVADKTYDGNIKASLSGGVLAGLVGSETLGFSGQSGVFADQNAASGKTVTVSGTTLVDAGSGATAGLAGNYSVSNPSGLLASIAQKALTVSGATAANRIYDGTLAVAVSGATLSGLVGSETVGLSGLSGVFADKNVGTAKAVTVSGAALTDGTNGGLASNYSVASPSGLSANVTKATISSVSNIVTDSKVYDGNTKATVSAASATFNGMASGDSLAFSATSALFLDKNVGTKTTTVSGIALTGTDAANYNLTSSAGTGTGSITPKAVTIINMTAVNKVYDGTTKANVTGGAISGTIGAETLGATGLVATFSDKNAGTGKTVTSTGTALVNGTGGGLASNYTVTNPTFTANITQKALTVSGMTAGSRVYDGTTLATLTGGALSGLVTGETLVFTGGSGVFVDKNAGSNKTITVSGSTIADAVAGGTGLASNYTVTNPTTVTGSITQKALTLSGALVASDKVYDGLTSASISGGVLSGFVGTETVGLAGLSGIFADKNAGNAKVVAVNGGKLANGTNGGLASNYSVSASGSLVANITQKALTVTGSTADNRVYDGTLAVTVSGGTLSGLVGAETVGVGSLSGVFADKNVGTAKAVTVSGAALTNGSNGGLASNYSVASPSGLVANVTQATISSVSNIVTDSKVYDANTKATVSAATATFNGMASGDSLSFSATSALFSDKNVGSKTTTVSGIALTGTDAANYTLTSSAGTGTGSITPKAVTIINMTAVNKVYDGTTKASVTGGAISGTIGSETLGATGLVATFNDANAGTGKTVTSTGTTLVNGTGGGLASNYTVTNPTFTANITPKALTVSGMTADSKIYDGSLAASLSGGALSGLVTGETLVLSGGIGLFGDKNVGAAKAVTVSGVGIADAFGGGTGLASNYSVTNPTTVTGSITQKALTISGATAANKDYDGSTKATLSGGTLDGLVAGETLTLAAAFADQNAAANKAVKVSVGTGTGLAGNYTLSNPDGLTASIAPKAVSVNNAAVGNKDYDGSTKATLSGGTLNGLVAGETLTLAAAFADQNAAANKAVKVSVGTGTGLAGNYTLSNPDGLTASIAPKAVSVSGATAGNKDYDGNTKATLSGGTLDGLVGGETLTLAAAFADKNAAANKVVTVSVGSGTGLAGNYTLSNPTGLTASIAPKALSVSGITAGNKVYDGNTVASLNTAGATFNGMVTDDKLTASASGAFLDKNAATGKDVNISGIALGGVDAGNYNLTATTAVAKADIAKATITGVAGITAGNKVYDGNTAASLNTLGATFNGMVTDDKLTASASGAFVDKNAATGKDVNISGIVLGGVDAGNYNLTGTTVVAKADIAKATITGVAGITAGNKVYDGNTVASLSTVAATFAGMVAGDSLTTSAASGAFSDKNVAHDKTVNISGIALGGTDAGNYTLGSGTASATADITAKALTLSGITASNKVYDGNTAASVDTSGATLVGMLAGDGLAVTGASGTFSDKNAAIGKTVTIGGIALGGTDAGNYTLAGATASVTADITAKVLTLTGQVAGNKVYDGNAVAQISGGTLSGLVGDETLAIGGQAGMFSDKNAANGKTVTVSGTTLLDTASGLASNYSVSNPTGLTASITQKALTVTGQLADNKVYDGNTVASLSGGTLNGLVGGETLVISGQTATFGDKNAANGKTVTVNGTTLLDTTNGLASNYSVTNPTGLTASITQKALTVTGQLAGNKVYDGSTQATLSGGALNGLVGSETLAIGGQTAVFSDKNAANGKTVTVNGTTLLDTANGLASNYSVSNPTGLTASITQKALTISGQLAGNKVYDGNAQAALSGGTLSGLVGSETLAIGGQKATFADKNAANGKAVTVSGTTLLDSANGMASNYTVSNPTGLTASISRAAISGVTGIAAGSKVYDGTTQVSLNTNTAGFAGIVAGDQLGVASAAGAFANKNAGSAKTVNVSGISLNGVDAGNYTLANTAATTTANIAQAQLAVTATGINKVYDATTNATVVLADNRIAGDVLSVSNGSASFANKNAGAGKTVTVGGIALAGADAGNYAFNTTAATAANITQAALGVKVNDAVKNQGQVNPAFSASYNGFLGSDTVASDVTGTLAFSTPATTASPAAAYQVAASGQASGNYAITYAPGVLTVNAVATPPVVTPPVADPAVRSAIGTVVAMSTIIPSQGNMVHAELIIDKGVPEVAAAPATPSEQTDKDGTAPVIQVSANVMRSVLPGLKLSIVDRGILLPPEMSGTPASGGSE